MKKPLHIRAGAPLLAGAHRHVVWGAHRVNRPSGTDDWQLIATLSGRGLVAPGLQAAPGILLLLPPATANDYVAAPGSGWDYAWIHFTAEPRIAPLLAWPGNDGPRRLEIPAAVAARLASRMLEIATILATPQRRRLERAQNALEDILLRADAWNPLAGPPPDQEIARALQAMAGAPERPWQLDGLARLAGLSRAQFTRRFRAATGTTAHGHLEALRLEQARALLLEDRGTVAEIARRLGFCSAGHFSERYLRRFGERPGRTASPLL